MRRSFVFLPTTLLALLGPLATPSHAGQNSFLIGGADFVNAMTIRVSVTITCFADPDAHENTGSVYFTLSQRPRGPVVARLAVGADCTGRPETFTVDVPPLDGARFHRGRATLTVIRASATACTWISDPDDPHPDDEFLRCETTALLSGEQTQVLRLR